MLLLIASAAAAMMVEDLEMITPEWVSKVVERDQQAIDGGQKMLDELRETCNQFTGMPYLHPQTKHRLHAHVKDCEEALEIAMKTFELFKKEGETCDDQENVFDAYNQFEANYELAAIASHRAREFVDSTSREVQRAFRIERGIQPLLVVGALLLTTEVLAKLGVECDLYPKTGSIATLIGSVLTYRYLSRVAPSVVSLLGTPTTD